jgi:hypothetical protein
MAISRSSISQQIKKPATKKIKKKKIKGKK